MVTQDASPKRIQDKHKIMQDIDTNSYLTNLTPLTIESKLLTSTHIKQTSYTQQSQSQGCNNSN